MSPETHQTAPADAKGIETWMVRYITSVIDVAADPFPVDARFDTYGLDSVEITIMCGMLEEEFEIEVNPGHVFDHPSVAEFARYLANRLQTRSVVA